MKSFKQLSKDGVLKRTDGYKAPLDQLVVDPMFNARLAGARLDEHIAGLVEFIMGGGQLPPLEVVPAEMDLLQVVDGHCRLAAYRIARDRGAAIEYIDVKPFQGNDADRVARIATSNEGLKLTPVETADVYKRLRGYGLNAAEIARRVGKTATHVGNVLLLADAPQELLNLVILGKVSATLAIDTIKEHGDKALAVLTDVMPTEPAEDAPKKVQRAAVTKWKLSGDLANRTVEALTALQFDFDAVATMTDDVVPDSRTVTLTKGSLLPLWTLIREIKEARGE